MRTVGDKGLSAGEDSYVDARDLYIYDSEIALTSKDRSRLVVTKAVINNSSISLAVYQKKSEFGPAYLIVNNLEASGAEIPFLVEEK